MNANLFANDLSKIKPSYSGTINLTKGMRLPTGQDIYFKAKQHELYERYLTARFYIGMTCADGGWDHWIVPSEDEQMRKAQENIIKSRLYEAALINYNIVVDLTWAWAYLSAVGCFYASNKDKSKNLHDLYPIEEAYSILREAEENAKSPTAKRNPFDDLKENTPQFKDAVDIVIDFWKVFRGDNIRDLYNFIKHRGTPIYTEVDDLSAIKAMVINIGGSNYPSDIRDIQRKVSIDEGIQELVTFDNNLLCPYIEKLYDALKSAIDPSPMASIV